MHAGLVREAEAEGASREGRADTSDEEEGNAVARGFHKTLRLLLCCLLSFSSQMALPSGRLSRSLPDGGSAGGRGCCVLPSPSFIPLLRLSASPLPPIQTLPLQPPSPWICWACCGGRAGVCPLRGTPPGGWFIIRGMMSWACSSGAPLPLNGEGATTSYPGSGPSLLVPPTPVPSPRFAGGGGD